MLKLLNKNLRILCNRLRWNSHRHAKPKIVIKKFGKPISKSNLQQHKPQNPKNAAVYPNTQTQTQLGTQIPIRIATFNAALFSMAPAVVPRTDPFPNISIKPSKSLNNRPKGILKQSPSHPNSKLNTHNNTNINKPDSLIKQQQQKFAKSKLRVSINLPDNEISLGRSRSRPTRTRSCLSEESSVWLDGKDELRGKRGVVDVLRELDADILALQDVKADEERDMKPLSELAAALGMYYVFADSWAPEYGNAVLSKWPILYSKVLNFFDHTDFRNVLKTTIDVPQVGQLNFYCTHLDHLNENWRMKQIDAIIESNCEPHILAGGLNSLDQCDYSQERWTDIVKYYEDIGKPTPKVEVMKYLKEKQYTDAKDFAGECESVVMIAKGQSVQGTCKYGTRLDYLLASPGLDYKFVPGSYAVLSSKGTSDHHIVKVDLLKNEENTQEITPNKKQPPKKRVVRITGNSSLKGIWSTDMR